MNLNIKLFQKAAANTAAFCLIFVSTVVGAKQKQSGVELETVKKKVINLLIQRQKKQALSVINDFIASDTNHGSAKEAKDFRKMIAQKFLTKEAQEAYEMSLNLTIESLKEAKKNNEDCLSRDPENLECLIQRIRLLHREKLKKPIEIEEIDKISPYFDAVDINWVQISTQKNSLEFKNNSFYKKEASRLGEDKLVFAILELDRSLAIKNFLKAKEVMAALEEAFPDWPDLIYFKNKVETDLTDNKVLNSTEALTQYINRCKSLPKTVVRKYRYDFDLCVRGSL